ncbi:MAG: dienelactone hydrolase family protein [Pirellulales bacterium]
MIRQTIPAVNCVTNSLDRRDCLRRMALAAAAVAAGRSSSIGEPMHAERRDVAWLPEVVAPPRDLIETPTEELAPLFVDSEDRAITTRPEWERQRHRLRQRWLDFLGPMPSARPPVKLEVLRRDETPQFVRQLVRYESEPGLWVEGYLLAPHKAEAGRLPALVAMHATSEHSIEQIAGLADKPSHHLAPRLCQAGFVVFCPRCFLWQNAPTYDDAVARFRERHPHTLGMHKMLYDAMRAVDVLQSLPNVDRDRIGAVGHSLGAKEALYLSAFDDRVTAAVASEGGIGLRSTNWNAPWYLGAAIEKEDFTLNHHQLLAMIAPRPFLIVAGETGPGAADGNRSWPLVAAAHPAYRFYDQPVRLGVYNHGLGHVLNPEIYARIEDWLRAYV